MSAILIHKAIPLRKRLKNKERPRLKERWRPVVGWEGSYDVSDWGRVRSVNRVVSNILSRSGNPHICCYDGKILSPSKSQIHFFVHIVHKKRTRHVAIHTLVLEAFVGPRPEGTECCHNDGDGFNNRLCNLRWDTHKNNEFDKLTHGTHIRGKRHPLSKLDNEDVLWIRSFYRKGVKGRGYIALAKRLGKCTPSVVKSVVDRKA